MIKYEGKLKLFSFFLPQASKKKMDSFAVNPKKSYHIRSNSLPSKSHPIVSQVDEHLCRVKGSETTTSSSSFCHKLVDLQGLQDCIDKLLLLPLTQQALGQESESKCVDDLLEGSLRLLDLCDTAKDALLQIKQCTNELESFLRRRRGDIAGSSDLQKCLISRKMIKKTIHKVLKGLESKCSQKRNESSTIISLLKEVEAVTYSSVQSLLSFIAGPKSPSTFSRWALVSKLVQPKRVACNDEADEVKMVDAALYSIMSQKSDFPMQVEDLQQSLKKFESSVRDLEQDLESLYRRLIKNRVALLNILNH